MGLLKRLLGLGGRGPHSKDEVLFGSEPLSVPDWVPNDVEEGVVKVRLFLNPAGGVPSLYELDLSEGEEPSPTLLRCFSPPAEVRGGADDEPRKVWTVKLENEEVGLLRNLAEKISLFPVGRASPSGEAATVELSLTAGQAEARIRWWMSPPEEWTGVDRFVARLRELAKHGG